MNQKSGISVAIKAICIVLALGLLGWGAIHLFRHLGTKPPTSELERISRMASSDKENLKNPAAREDEVFAALVRLAQQKDPGALKEATLRSTSPSPLIRGGAANAIGYYDDAESFDTLKKLLNDKEPTVRIQALYALSRRQGVDKEKAFNEYLKNEGITSAEKISIYSLLLQSPDLKKSREMSIQGLTSEYNKVSDLGMKMQAVMILSQFAGADKRLTELYKKIITDGTPQPMVVMAMRGLATQKDPWLAKNYSTFLQGKVKQDATLRLAAIQVLHIVCPSNRWQILEGIFKKETDLNVRLSSLAEVKSMPGTEAKTFLKMVLEGGYLKENETAVGKTVQAELEQNAGVDPCSVQKK